MMADGFVKGTYFFNLNKGTTGLSISAHAKEDLSVITFSYHIII
jgi:hypothetical protein